MDLAAVMEEIGASVRGVAGLEGRTFAYPPPKVDGFAGIVSYPERIDYDQTYGRGMDMIRDLPVLIVVGRATDRTARDRVAQYAAGFGALSVKAAIEAEPHTSFDDVHVTTCEFDVVSIAAVDYITAMFRMDVAGQGA